MTRTRKVRRGRKPTVDLRGSASEVILAFKKREEARIVEAFRVLKNRLVNARMMSAGSPRDRMTIGIILRT